MALAMLAGLAFCAVAHAEVHVSGSKRAVIIKANDASLRSVVAAVNGALHTQIVLRSSVAHRVTGTYSGTVQDALSRMLTGCNYILNANSNRIVLTVFRRGETPNGRALNEVIQVPPNTPVHTSGNDVAVGDNSFQGWTGSWFPNRHPERKK